MKGRSRRLLLLMLATLLIVAGAIVTQVVVPGNGDSATAATLGPDGARRPPRRIRV